MGVTGTIIETNGPEYTKRVMQRVNLDALAAAVAHWHERIMPGHFTIEGGKKYNYKPRRGDNEPPMVLSKSKKRGYAGRMVRNRNYSWRKRRLKHHNIPLVWTGATRDAAKRMVKISTRRRSGGVIESSAAMSLPRYFYMYRKDQNQPNKYAELVSTVPADVAELLKKVNDEIAAGLKNAPTKRTVKKLRP